MSTTEKPTPRTMSAEREAELFEYADRRLAVFDDPVDPNCAAFKAELIAERAVSDALLNALKRTTFALRQGIQRAERNSFDGHCPENWLEAEAEGKAAIALAEGRHAD